MGKFYAWLIVTLILFSTCSVYAENKQKLSDPGSPISETKMKFSGELTPLTKDQDFYKATVQAYKDFNEQVVKYIGMALTIVSALVTGLVIWFVFLFRKT